MARDTRRSSQAPRQRSIRRLLISDALSSWVPPTVAVVVVLLAMLLNAIDLLSSPITAAIVVISALVIGAFTILSPRLQAAAEESLSAPVLAAIAVAWIAVLYYPFHCRLFPGAPLASLPLESAAHGTPLPATGRAAVDLVLDARLPLESQHANRTLHYAVDLIGDGNHLVYEGDLGDRWQTRRLGRRGTTQSHIEHLSTLHLLPAVSTGPLTVDHVDLSGVPGSSLTGTLYAHRTPALPWLVGGGTLLTLGALAFDMLWDPRGTPMTALVTATAAAAAVVFVASGSGHPGVRDVIGAGIVGALIGVPSASAATWVARMVTRSSQGRAQRRSA